MNDYMRVSDVAAKYGISKRTIKFYEEAGILKSKREEESNYRVYDSNSLDRLEKILILRRLNFTIEDIGQILASDNKRTQEIFRDKLNRIQDDIRVLSSLQGVVQSFLELSNNVGIDNVNIYQLLSEQIYIHKKVERVISMNKYEGDLLRIEIGKEIIPCADSIIDQIKLLRSSLLEREQIETPLIRLTDVEQLSDFQYRIIFKGSIAIDKKLHGENPSDELDDLIRDLKDVILCNAKELVK